MLRNCIILLLIITGLYLLISPVFDLAKGSFLAEEAIEPLNIESGRKERSGSTNEEEFHIVQPPYCDGDTIGYVKIESLKIGLPLIEGRNQKDLRNGIGHHEQTSYPNEEGIIGLVAYQENKSFQQLYSVDKGELIQITDFKDSYTYEIYQKERVTYEECIFSNKVAGEEIRLVTPTEDKGYLFVVYAKRIIDG